MPSAAELLATFPRSETELRVVFSEPMERESVEDPSNYATRTGLKIIGAQIDRDDPRKVALMTEPMNGEAMGTDILNASAVRTELTSHFGGL